MAVGFDPANSKVLGEPHPVVENVMQAFAMMDYYHTAAGQFSISDAGWLLYASGGLLPDPKNSLVWVDQNGKEEAVTEREFPFWQARLSPDGQRIAYVTMGLERRIWVYDLARGTNSQLTFKGRAHYPFWSATGKKIVFEWIESCSKGRHWLPYDWSSPMELYRNPTGEELGLSSPDGRSIAVSSSSPGTGFDIALMDTQSAQEIPFLYSKFDEAYPEVSPDGRWIAYTSNENQDRSEVYVQDFPGLTFKCQVSTGGGREPLWSRDGKRIFYRWLGQIWAAEIKTDGGFMPGKPVMLFEHEQTRYSMCYPMRCWDLSRDSQRFLMVKREQMTPAPVTELILVQNWFEELKRLVPTGK